MTGLLQIRDLELRSSDRILVNRLSLSIAQGESLALVGESGSGKSITALAVTGLLPEGEVRVTAGEIKFSGSDLLAMADKDRRRIAGAKIAMIFQEPMTSLNPVLRIGDQIVEMIHAHEKVSRRSALARAKELLVSVEMPEPELRLRAFPHQLSGGQRQRVMIAIALACRPILLIADEPTTALDVTVQARILTLLRELRQELNMAMLFITHDLGVVANIADRAAIMYCGDIVETASVKEIFSAAAHPYTRGLLACIPSSKVKAGCSLATIPGQLPGPSDQLTACRFAPRCALGDETCRNMPPPLITISPNHYASCHHIGCGDTA